MVDKHMTLVKQIRVNTEGEVGVGMRQYCVKSTHYGLELSILSRGGVVESVVEK